MSNLIKSGFVAFSSNDAVLIQPSDSKILKSVEKNKESKIIRPVGEELEDIEDLDIDEILKEQEETVEEIDPEEILNDAYNQAEEIINNANAQALEIKEKASKEGYDVGYNEGAQKADEEREKMLKELEASKASIKTDYDNMYNSMIEESQEKISDIIYDLVEKITCSQCMVDNRIILNMVNSALKDSEESRKYNIHISSEDFEYLNSHKNEIYGSSNLGISIDFFEDGKLEKNQCTIETDNGVLDISLDAKLKTLSNYIRILSNI